MLLMTKAIEKTLPPLRSTDGGPLKGKRLVAKFFAPWGNWTWYVTEGERTENGDFEFFGRIDGHSTDWGYFRLSELEEIKGPFGLKIERDRGFKPTLSGAISEKI